jgi:putative endonuclease
MVERRFWVYIMTNPAHTVLYTGVTSDLRRRVWEHREGMGSAFVRKYHVTHLVYYEAAERALAAISREKQIKAGSARTKRGMVTAQNPEWKDLYDELN